MKRWLLLLMLLSLPAWAAPTPVEIKAEVDKTKIEVGQPLKLTIDLLVAPGADLAAVPPEKFTFPPFEVRDAARVSLPAEGDTRKIRYTFKLAPFEEGKLTIPAASFPYKSGDKQEEAKSPELSVEVTRVPTEPQADIKDLKAGEASPLPAILYVAAALLALFVMMALWALVKSFARKRNAVAKEPPLPPYEYALRELARLEKERLPEQGRTEEYYDRLTAALRNYLSWRYGVPMLERTSYEILTDLRRQETLPAEPFTTLKRTLEEADLVKFARFAPAPTVCDERLGSARELIEFARPAEKKDPELAGAGGRR